MANVVLLDGGLGQEVIRRSAVPPTPMWSTEALIANPALMRGVQVDFIRAGARVLTVGAYTLTRPRLFSYGFEERHAELIAAALSIAEEARDEAGIDDVALACPLPPLVASYQPEATLAPDVMLDQYRELVEASADRVDLFVCETMSTLDEGRSATQAASEAGVPVWTAFTLDDAEHGRLRSGEPLDAAIDAAIEAGAEAVLANCSAPEAVTAAIPLLADRARRCGGYANGFVTVEPLAIAKTVAALQARTDIDPDTYADIALGWVEAGAEIVGGCCEIGPAHIARLSERLIEAGHVIVSRFGD